MRSGNRDRLANGICAGVLALVLTAPAIAVLAPPMEGEAIAIFPPGSSLSAVLLAAAAADARDLNPLPGGYAVRLTLPEAGAAALRREGALLVIRPVFAAGCNQSQTQTMEAGS